MAADIDIQIKSILLSGMEERKRIAKELLNEKLAFNRKLQEFDHSFEGSMMRDIRINKEKRNLANEKEIFERLHGKGKK